MKLLSRILFTAMLVSAVFSACARPAFAKTDYYLALKGGISLGSYETGANRTILKYLQQNRDKAQLVSFSGASAGSLNSVLSALDQCVINKQISNEDVQRFLNESKRYDEKFKRNFLRKFSEITDSLDNNFMRSAWDLGIDDLVPTGENEVSYKTRFKYDQNKHGATDVGLFSRISFEEKRVILELLKNREARPDCDIAITMSITKFKAFEYEISSIGATIKLQRFVVPIRVIFDPDTGKIAFRNFNLDLFEPQEQQANHNAQQASKKIPGPYLKLLEDCDANGTCQVGFDAIWNLAMASSAFPFAFHPVKLTVCYPHLLDKGEHCTEGEAETALFSDGGLFDNSPIGVAWDLSEVFRSHSYHNRKIIYINPDSFRTVRSKPKSVEHSSNIGAMEYLDYFSDSFNTAHESIYKSSLQEILSEETGSRNFYISSRYHHLLADLHLHFGAFYAREYRMHDYLVGVYDGANVIAQLECDAKSQFQLDVNRFKSDYRQCLRMELLNWIKYQSVADEESFQFLQYLYDSEYDKSLASEKQSQGYINTYIALSKSFETIDKASTDTLSYLKYLGNLREFKPRLKLLPGSDLEKILNSGKTYTSRKVSKMYENIILMQELAGDCYLCENNQLDENIATGLMVGETFVDSYLSQLDSNIWPKPIDGVVGLSYGFNINQKNQVYGLEYRPNLGLLSQHSLSIDFGLMRHDFGRELADDDYYSLSLALLKHRDDLLFTSWGVGYQWDSKGKHVYDEDLSSVFARASFLNELITLKYLYRTDKIRRYNIQTRDRESFVVSIDLSRICQMVALNKCPF